MTLDPVFRVTLDRFHDLLVATGKSAHTIAAYTRDVPQFGEWFSLTNSEPLSPEGITPSNVRECRRHLLAVDNCRPATVNR